MKFIFTKYAEKQFRKLDFLVQKKITEKLIQYKTNNKITLKKVHNIEPATHRIRVGNYRLLLYTQENKHIILKVAHRSEIYKT